MPNENDDEDHTITVPAATSTVAVAPTSSLSANPTDHPDRPTKPKPTDTETEDETKKPTQTGSPTSSTTSKPTSTSSHANWLPSFFPTFGVSAKTQIWIYGSIALIILFCVSLSVYLFLARRKRLRNDPREDYEFDLISDEQALLSRGGDAQAGRRSKRRAGELYDAFAEGSGSEEEFSDNDEEAHGYTDAHHVIGDDEESLEGGNEKELSEKA